MNRRITKPPGGEASDIFSNSPTTTPPSTPRKVKNYLASTIFSEERNGPTPKARQGRAEGDSFNRLFGAGGKDASDGGSPVRVRNYQKSNIMSNETTELNGKAYTNGGGAKNGHASPGHGSDSGMGSGSVTPNGSSGGSTNGDAEPRTNGHNNGHSNGHGNGNGHIEHGTPSRRNPPGGFSSIGNIFSP